MKKEFEFPIGLIILILLVLPLSGCSKIVQEIESGIYVSKDKLSSLSIEEDRTFQLKGGSRR